MRWEGIKVSIGGLIVSILAFLSLIKLTHSHLPADIEVLASMVMLVFFFLGLFAIAFGVIVFEGGNRK